jgi:hypothetical protein
MTMSQQGVTLGLTSIQIELSLRQGLSPVHVRSQLEQLQDTFMMKLGHVADKTAQVELKRERV